ncbi:hypothetical protein TRICI_000900 [Trichomonascus ciferrii]|uniref:Alanyl-transfer RNA synthetases family profile domain-containing protein n=1 Tax=Trichomonascus ciferrii TaxID=44093 RepID=A0A642VAW4_9ASCO|nr:hypothetical protein TRICI_000900 [Trichomonascus ciferrii]
MSVVLSGAARSGSSTIVGLLACQREPYLKSLKTHVVGCEKLLDKKKQEVVGYELELKDTILFPEGGGQPFDTGSLKHGEDTISVSNVQRDGLTAVHIADKPVEPGTEVAVDLDWARRYDHMQQHTGQHLLSAVLDRRNVETVGWNLGPKFCYVELPRKLSAEEVAEVQEEVNQKIQEAINIKVELNKDVDHKVPDNYDVDQGVVRVIHIGDLDSNPCCGTHLRNTAEISSITLLHSVGIRGTNSRLFFLAGNRVRKYASEAHEIIRKAGAALSCQPEDIEDKINRQNQAIKDLTSKERFWAGQVAKFEAQDLKRQLEQTKFAVLHKPDGSMEYLKNVEKELGKLEPGMGTYVLMCGQGKQGGAIVANGDEVESCVEKIKSAVPNVKGGGKGKWQGKVVSYEKGAIESLMKNLEI